MPATINDIAKAAKVSKATISYVINDKPGVGEETRQRVLAIMSEMNFKPNAVARGLAGQRTETLGLVIPDITDMFYASIIRGVENTANEFGYTLNLCTTHAIADRERKGVESCTSRMVDGVIIMTYFLDEQYLIDIQRLGIPMISLDNPDLGPSFHSVTVDNEEAGYIATKHLLELGHRRIAFMRGNEGSKDSELRLAGYRRALAECEVGFDQDLITCGEFNRSKGYEAMKTLLKTADYPTAVFAANDYMALGAMSAAFDQGLNVPRDLSVIGVDDIEAAALVDPPLTTIKQPTYAMGQIAIKMLMALVRGETPEPRKVLLHTELVRRGSSAPVRLS